jgi:probable rRNA maturation factor
MILIDPDLEPDTPRAGKAVRGGLGAAPKAASAKKTAVGKDEKIPSARTLDRFLALAQTAVRLRGEVNVQLTTDAAIRRLNRQFRGQDKATDVLSFPAEGIGAEELAGDLAVSVPTALRQAAEQGHSLAVEIKVLILHGLLHLAGYDHEADNGKMARRERTLRARLRLPQGLIERAEGHGKSLSGAKARVDSKQGFRSLKAPAPSGSDRSVDCEQGLKPGPSTGVLPARLKSCPVTKQRCKASKKVSPIAGGR